MNYISIELIFKKIKTNIYSNRRSFPNKRLLSRGKTTQYKREAEIYEA